MQTKLLTAVFLSFALFVTAACSSSSQKTAVDEAETRAEEAETAAEEAAARAEEAATRAEEAATRADEAETRADEAETEAEEAETRAEEAETRAQEAETRAQEAETRAQEAERRAREEAQQQLQTLEANQRAQRMLDFLATITVAPDPSVTSSRVTISVPSRNSLTFTKTGYTSRSISAPSLRGAELTQSRGGTQTAVVYTDIELSRSLIKTYDTDATDDAETIPAGDITGLTGGNFLSDTDAFVITNHGFPSSKAAADTVDPKSGTSFNGSLNGIPGKYECTGADCMTLTPTYTDGTRLTGVGVSGIATFKPNSRTASVPLCDSPASQCAATDSDYMAFGWWRSESTDGSYAFEPFAFGPALAESAPAAAQNASFDGTAVGVYVEQDLVGSAISKKQGEFIADARLDHDGTDLTGTIDGFITTPTGGSGEPSTTGWVVKLNASEVTALQLHGPDGAGTWEHRYTTDGSAVVGTFESELAEVLHIVGAFGARQ